MVSPQKRYYTDVRLSPKAQAEFVEYMETNPDKRAHETTESGVDPLKNPGAYFEIELQEPEHSAIKRAVEGTGEMNGELMLQWEEQNAVDFGPTTPELADYVTSARDDITGVYTDEGPMVEKASSARKLLNLVNRRIENSPYAPVGKTQEERERNLRKWLDRHPGPYYVDRKLRGERVHIWKKGDKVIIANRKNAVYAGTSFNNHAFPDFLLAAIRKALKGSDGEFDAEYRARDDVEAHYRSGKSGHSPYTKEMMVSIFDVLALDGNDLRELPLSERRRLLKDHVKTNPQVELVQTRNAASPEEVIKIYEDYLDKGYEGIVAKPVESPYLSGKSNWSKVKNYDELDVALIGIAKSEKWKEKKEAHSFLMGVRDKKTGKWVEIGDVSVSGLDDKEKEAISADVKRRLPTIKESEDTQHVHTKPFEIAEVAYESITEKGRLDKPRIVRIRDDKSIRSVSAAPYYEAFSQEHPNAEPPTARDEVS